MKQVSGDVKNICNIYSSFSKTPFKQIRTGNVIFVHFGGKELYQVQDYCTSFSSLDIKIFLCFYH
jgi:hypothetical protein